MPSFILLIRKEGIFMNILILAGGSGTRLWPLSRKTYPKQFLDLITDQSLIQETALRVKDYPVYVVTNQNTDFIIESQLKEVLDNFTKKHNIILEPVARNTAPAIAYASSFFSDEEILAILPADHTIANEKAFAQLLKDGEELAIEGNIVTFGIQPSRPETGYGYIKTTSEKIDSAFKVDSFKEKPDLKTAEQYIKEGNYYWNSGMFIFSVKTIKEELKKHCPEIYNLVASLSKKESITAKDYEKFPNISIDYAIMEKTDRLLLIPADIGWNDIGGFDALADNLPKDKDGNSIKGRVDYYSVDSGNNLVFSTMKQRLVTTVGVQNLAIIETDDALLIADKKDSQKVKDMVELLKKDKRDETEIHKKVFRPWGYYRSIVKEKNYHVKEIAVYPGQRLSLQSHAHRSESWTIVEGDAVIDKGETLYQLQQYRMIYGNTIFIPVGFIHRLSNHSKDKNLKIVEVQMGDYLGEDDIVRYEDDYGRGRKK